MYYLAISRGKDLNSEIWHISMKSNSLKKIEKKLNSYYRINTKNIKVFKEVKIKKKIKEK